MLFASEKYYHLFLILTLSLIFLLGVKVPLLLGKPIDIRPKFLISGSKNQSLAIRLDGLKIHKTSQINFDLGDGIHLASYSLNPNSKELKLNIKSVSKEATVGHRLATVRIPFAKNLPTGKNYKIYKLHIWVI